MWLVTIIFKRLLDLKGLLAAKRAYFFPAHGNKRYEKAYNNIWDRIDAIILDAARHPTTTENTRKSSIFSCIYVRFLPDH